MSIFANINNIMVIKKNAWKKANQIKFKKKKNIKLSKFIWQELRGKKKRWVQKKTGPTLFKNKRKKKTWLKWWQKKKKI